MLSKKYKMEDKLTDFERAEYYKIRLKNANRRLVFYCALWFVLGVVVARALYFAVFK